MSEFIDQSTASVTEKLRRVLTKLHEGSAVYFYDDGYPRYNSVKQDSEAALCAVVSLESELSACRKELEEVKESNIKNLERWSDLNTELAKELEEAKETLFELKCERNPDLSAARQQERDRLAPIREGWVMVPLEPTKEMVIASLENVTDEQRWISGSRKIYKAMIAAVKKD